MRKPLRALLVAIGLAGALGAPVPSQATHAGCLATTAVPSCTYTAMGEHSAIPVVASSWEITVVRNGVTFILANGPGGAGDVAIHDVGAAPGEVVTVTIKSDGPGGLPVGLITSGNTSGHLG